MIADVDATVAAWLSRFVPDIEIAFAPPPDDGPVASTPRRLTLTAFLSDVREDLDSGEPGWIAMRDPQGVVVGRRPPNRSYRLTYLLFACGTDPVAEHEVLGRVLAGSLLEEVLPDEVLRGLMRSAEAPLSARCARAGHPSDTRELWAAWGIRPRTTLELSILAPMPPPMVHEVAPPPRHLDLAATRVAGQSLPPSGIRQVLDPPARTARVTED